MDDEKMRRYDPSWSDEQVIEWTAISATTEI